MSIKRLKEFKKRSTPTSDSRVLLNDEVLNESFTVPSSAFGGGEADSVDWANVFSKPPEATRWAAWSEVTNKPTEFPPSSHGHSAATTSTDGFMASTDKTKLNGIEASAEVNPANTDDLNEGTVNLYHTDARASSAAPVQDVNGQTGSVTVSVPVDSVNGKTGTISLTSSDVGALASIDGVSNAGGDIDLVAGGDVSLSPDNANNKITISVSVPIDSVAGKTGTVTLNSADVGLGNVSNDQQVKRAGDTMQGNLSMDTHELRFGGSFKMVYNATNDSLDIEVI